MLLKMKTVFTRNGKNSQKNKNQKGQPWAQLIPRPELSRKDCESEKWRRRESERENEKVRERKGEKGRERKGERTREKGRERERERERKREREEERKDEQGGLREKKAEREEEEDVLQLLYSGSEESGEESWEIDSSTAAEIEESLNRARRRGPGLKDW